MRVRCADRSNRRGAGTAPRERASRWWIRVVQFGFPLLVIGCACLAATPAFAQQIDTGINFGTATGLSTTDIRVVVARIIRAFIAILGIIAILIVLAGGFLWMTSGGEEQKVSTAKQILTNGAIGLTIILLSFSIAQFVLSRLLAASGSGTVSSAGGGGVPSSVFLSGALGAGPIESHFPERGATDVARNIRIFVTFREAVQRSAFIADSNANGRFGTTGPIASGADNYFDRGLPEAIQVFAVSVGVDPNQLTPQIRQQNPAAFAREATKLVPVGIAVTPDDRTIVLQPVVVNATGLVTETTPGSGVAQTQLLGSATQPTSYIVRLTSAIKKFDGSDVFSGAWSQGYTWDFAVSTRVDLTPPKVVSVIPLPDTGSDTASGVVGVPDVPTNAIVQITFDEAMDPTVTTGTYSATATNPFTILAVQAARQTTPIEGAYAIQNQYRTVEFVSNRICGQNSCGGDIYCLPANASLTASATAATLTVPGQPMGNPFSGVMDAAGNSLDGDGDGRAEGPGTPRFVYGARTATTGTVDSIEWPFVTSSALDLTPPQISGIFHYDRRDVRQSYSNVQTIQDVSLTQPVEVLWSELMSGSTTGAMFLEEVTGLAGALLGCDPLSGQRCLWHGASMAHEDTTAPPDGTLDQTRVRISHAPLRDVQTGQPVPQYRVRVDANARDLYQNCFFDPTLPGPQGPAGGQRCIGPQGSETCSTIP